MVAFWEYDPKAPASPMDGVVRGEVKWPAVIHSGEIKGLEGGGGKAVYNCAAAVRVDRLVEKVDNPSCFVGPFDILDEECFTSFGALNSGLVISKKGVCSLNCGGKCELCRQSKFTK